MENLKKYISFACYQNSNSPGKSDLINSLKEFLVGEFDKTNREHVAVVFSALNTLELI